MAYIGTTPTSGDFVLLDSITTSATASYTMQRNSVNFEPQSANHMIVSLNGTIQAPVSSFTVSGSTLTFASALTSSDVIDFILVLGNVNDVGTATTVVDSAITKNKLNLISESSSAGLTVKGDGSSENGTIQLNCSQNSHGVKISSPAHSAGQSYELILPTGNVTADKFLKVASVSGSGTTGIGQLSFADAGETNSPYWFGRKTNLSDQYLTRATKTKVTNMSDDEADSHSAYSSDRFTVPSGHGGIYLVTGCILGVSSNAGGDGEEFNVYVYKNGTEKRTSGFTFDPGGKFNSVYLNLVGLIELAAGDYVELYAELSDDDNSNTCHINGGVGTHFGGFKIA